MTDAARRPSRRPAAAVHPPVHRLFVAAWRSSRPATSCCRSRRAFAAGPLGADATGVGIAIGAFSVAALLLRPVVGWASDRVRASAAPAVRRRR